MQNLDHNIAPVNEVFISQQGEGNSVGTTQIFVRFASCNFWENGHPCKWINSEGKDSVCDTAYSGLKSMGKEISIDNLIKQIQGMTTCRNIFLTGGEVLQYPLFVQKLTFALHNLYYDIEIQTNGNKPIWKSKFIKWSVDLKSPSCGNSQYNNLKNLKLLSKKDQLKCVIANWEDFTYAISIISKRNLKCQIFFQPAWGILDPVILSQWIKDSELWNVRLSTQQQKYIFGATARGV